MYSFTCLSTRTSSTPPVSASECEARFFTTMWANFVLASEGEAACAYSFFRSMQKTRQVLQWINGTGALCCAGISDPSNSSNSHNTPTVTYGRRGYTMYTIHTIHIIHTNKLYNWAQSKTIQVSSKQNYTRELKAKLYKWAQSSKSSSSIALS